MSIAKDWPPIKSSTTRCCIFYQQFPLSFWYGGGGSLLGDRWNLCHRQRGATVTTQPTQLCPCKIPYGPIWRCGKVRHRARDEKAGATVGSWRTWRFVPPPSFSTGSKLQRLRLIHPHTVTQRVAGRGSTRTYTLGAWVEADWGQVEESIGQHNLRHSQ